MRVVPNTNHYLEGAAEEVAANMLAYYDAFLQGTARPDFTWTYQDDGSMVIETATAPKAVYLWKADNPYSRDFRQITIGASWTSSVLVEQSPGIYIADPGIPTEGWRSYFVELVYEYSTSTLGLTDLDYHFTTEIRVLPEPRPFEADFNRDGVIDAWDLVILAENWLTDRPYYDIILAAQVMESST